MTREQANLLFQATQLEADARRWDEIAEDCDGQLYARFARDRARECRRRARHLRERAEGRVA